MSGRRRFSGVVALVTGAGSGIGAAIARGLDDEDAHVVLADVDGAALARVAESLPGTSTTVVDVSDSAAVTAAFDEVVTRHGWLDLVAHAAGVDDGVAKQLIADAMVDGRAPEVTASLSDESWRRVLSINLDGTFHVLRAAMRAMVPRRSGTVVVIGSSSAFDAPTAYPHYSASKAGVHALAQASRRRRSPSAFGSTCWRPVPPRPAWPSAPGSPARHHVDQLVPPYARPEQIAEIAPFLGSADASNLVGQRSCWRTVVVSPCSQIRSQHDP